MQTIVNLGTGGADLNGQNGSTASEDTNDATFVPWPSAVGGNYWWQSGNSNLYLSAGYESWMDTADIDFRAHIVPSSISAARIAGRWSGSGFRHWSFDINSDAEPKLVLSSDGTNSVTYTATAAVDFSTTAALWWRFTLDADNGAGGHDVAFYTSTDNVTWTQVGSTITTAGTFTPWTSTQRLDLGGYLAGCFQGQALRYQMSDTIDGTPNIDVDTSVITSAEGVTFTALTGQEVSCTSSNAAFVTSVRCVAPLWQLSTDDYIEIPNSSLLNFTADDDFTIVFMHVSPRNYLELSDMTLLAKKADLTSTTQGYALSVGYSTIQTASRDVQIGDGTNGVEASSDNLTIGNSLQRGNVLIVTRNSGTLNVYMDGELQGTQTDTTGDLTNSDVLRIGRLSGSGEGYIPKLQLLGAAVFRRALNATEVAAVTTYYQNRWP